MTGTRIRQRWIVLLGLINLILNCFSVIAIEYIRQLSRSCY